MRETRSVLIVTALTLMMWLIAATDLSLHAAF
jgi:hypothetical protein